MSTTATPSRSAAAGQSKADELLISSDSHVIEDSDLWTSRVAAKFKDRAPKFPPRKAGTDSGFSAHDGGFDPKKRLDEAAVDGVRAEVLYPSLALTLFGLDDAALQEECFRVYNDWLVEYCQVSPDRLLGVACLSAYNIENSIKELERCRKAGMRGALVWQVPHPDMPFTGTHYERLWAAAQDMDMPISLHILSGHGYAKKLFELSAMDGLRHSVLTKCYEAGNCMFDLIYSNVFERFPRLKFVMVENEIGWLPFVVEQWDRYYDRFKGQPDRAAPMKRHPSEYVEQNFYASFFNDPAGAHLLARWGQNNCMWSNDFPHGNSTWPNSRSVIARDLGHLSTEVRRNVLSGTVARLYGIDLAKLA